jgi:hypothetical protein
MSEESNNIHKTVSTQSFEILGETPKTNNKDCSYDVLPNDSSLEKNDYDDEPQILDEDIENINDIDNKLYVPYNSPLKESYYSKKEQVKNVMLLLKESGINAKTRREIRALERHLEKLEENEKNDVDYFKFKTMMVENAKNDKNMNQSLKELYS